MWGVHISCTVMKIVSYIDGFRVLLSRTEALVTESSSVTQNCRSNVWPADLVGICRGIPLSQEQAPTQGREGHTLQPHNNYPPPTTVLNRSGDVIQYHALARASIVTPNHPPSDRTYESTASLTPQDLAESTGCPDSLPLSKVSSSPFDWACMALSRASGPKTC